MNSNQVYVLSMVAAVLVFALFLVVSVSTKTQEQATDCYKSGGNPQKISGEVICFAPNVIIQLHSENPQ